MEQGISTTRVVSDARAQRLLRRKVQIEVIAGPDMGTSGVFGQEEVNVGSLGSNDLVLTDSSVSRYHLRISGGARGFDVRDLDSTNGSFVHGLRLGQITAAGPTEITLGETVLRLTPLADEVEVPLHDSDRFGAMLGASPHMRALFAQLKPVAASEATVLIDGETGTGKELLAEEIHKNSPRAKGPFIVTDCGAIPEHLMESELFGHTRGSFTGATSDRTGAFQLAEGGTVFLDEIGELSAAAQPKLLRVLENRSVKRVGAGQYAPVNVRIIAATNRDLKLAVNEGTFRADLYYRLSVVRLRLPPLRERPEDIELLATVFMRELWSRAGKPLPPPALGRETIQRLVAHRWPGNVRELHNFMERVVVLAGGHADPALELDSPGEGPAAPSSSSSSSQADVGHDLPYKEAKMKWIDQFEMAYVTTILDRHRGNVAAAARAAGVDRTYLFRLIRKYDLRK